MTRRRRASMKRNQASSPDVSLSVTSAYVNRIITAIMTAGGEVLKNDYGFGEEQLGEWAQKTVKQAKVYLGLADDRESSESKTD